MAGRHSRRLGDGYDAERHPHYYVRNVNQTPQSLTLPEGHYGVVSTPHERDNVNCAAAHRGASTSLPPSAMHPDESVVEMQLRSHDPNTDMATSKG